MGMYSTKNQKRRKVRTPRSIVTLREGERQFNNQGMNAARRLKAREKVLRAVDLRYQGWSWAKIAEEVGWSNGGTACRLTYKFLAAQEEPAKEIMRRIQRERLEAMYAGLVKAGVLDGKPRHVEVAVKLLERGAKLDGLDAPAEGAGGGNVSITLQYIPHPKEGMYEVEDHAKPIIEGEVIGTPEHRALEAPARSV